MGEYNLMPEVRFWAKVNMRGPVPEHVREVGNCWTWTGNVRSDGYGRFNAYSGAFGAHVFSWLMTRGRTRVQSGYCVLHVCDMPTCVRPDHLFIGTVRANIRDMDGKRRRGVPAGERSGRVTKPECTPRGELHCHAKLTESDVREIRSRVAAGEPQLRLAREKNVGPAAIFKIVRRERWKHVTP